MLPHTSILTNGTSRMRHTRAIALYAIFLLLSVPVGTLCHEVIGHGAVGILAGGRVVHVEVLGVGLWPKISWTGWPDRWGGCGVAGVPTPTGGYLVYLCGSISTWVVAVMAVFVLWIRRWHGWKRTLLICCSFWWFDLLTYTLPSWGLKRYVLFGNRFQEPYDAAVSLGIPGPVFQAAVVGVCVLIVVALIVRLRRDSVVKKSASS